MTHGYRGSRGDRGGAALMCAYRCTQWGLSSFFTVSGEGLRASHVEVEETCQSGTIGHVRHKDG